MFNFFLRLYEEKEVERKEKKNEKVLYVGGGVIFLGIGLSFFRGGGGGEISSF